MKKVIIILAAVLSVCTAKAENFIVDSVEYYLAYPADSVVAVRRCWQMSGDVIIPENVTYSDRTYKVNGILSMAFYGQINPWVSTISLPNTIKYIKDDNFNNLNNLTEITIPSSVEEIGSSSFNHCAGLSSVELHVLEIGSWSFCYCQNLVSVKLSNSVTYVYSGSFSNNSSLTEVVIGDACTHISGNCFQNCLGLKKITIGSSLREVGMGCFASIQGGQNPQYAQIDTIIVHGDNPPTCPFGRDFGIEVYGIDYHTTILVVPCNTTSIYEQASGWNQFFNIVEDCSISGISTIDAESDVLIYAKDGRINLQSDIVMDGAVFDIDGRQVACIRNGQPSQPLPHGVYLVKVDILPARKVVVIR